MRNLPLIFCLLAAAVGATTQPSAPTTRPADPDRASTLTIANVDGTVCHPLQVPRADRAVVLVFVAVDCPISNGYAPELRRIMAAESPRGFDFRLVYCDSTQTPPAVKAHRSTFGYTCPALLDPQHLLANAVGATVTPEAAVIESGQRPAATVHDLIDVLGAIADGRPIPTALTPVIGCSI